MTVNLPLEMSVSPNLFLEATEDPALLPGALQTLALDLETPFAELSPGVINNMLGTREFGEAMATLESYGPAGTPLAWNEIMRAFGDGSLANWQRAAALSAGVT